MNARRPLLPLLCVVASALTLSACLGSSSGPSAPLAVEFSVAPPLSDTLGTTFQVAAEVSNGSNVNWSCTPTGACGSFNPTQTGSGVSTTYMPPTTVPQGGSVTIMAVSVQDNTKEASANVTITAGGAVSVTFNPPPPPPTLATNANATISATITSTVTNAVSDGIDWTPTCTNSAGGGCGTFSTAHTNSGVATTYFPPTTVPAAGLNVTLTAASTLDPMDDVTAVINVSTTQTSAFLCASCSYTYTVSGVEASTGDPYSLAGVFTTDGMGNITSGEQDFSDYRFSTLNTADTIESGSTYQFTADGRGTLTVVTNDTNIGISNGLTGTETFAVAFVSAHHALLTEIDGFATGSGTLDLQTVGSFSNSTLSDGLASNGFTFVFGGGTFGGLPIGFGGVFSVNNQGTISGTGSTSDINSGGSIAKQQTLTGGYTSTDQLGRIQLTLMSSAFGNVNLTGPMILNGYITDATHVKFVEVDQKVGVSSGLAIGQGAMTGTLSSASVLPANTLYVFTAFGSVPDGAAALAATFTSDGVSKLNNGLSDVNESGVPTSGTIATGSYSVDSSGTGRVGISLTGNTIVGNAGTADNFVIYLNGGTDPPLAMELDQYGVTTGNLYTQSGGPFTLTSFQGNYGLNYTQFAYDAEAEEYVIESDTSGQAFADGAGNLLGTLDINYPGSPEPDQAFTGAYSSSASGRFTGLLSSPIVFQHLFGAGVETLGFSYFVVSPSQVVIIETDSTAVSLGIFQLQTPPF